MTARFNFRAPVSWASRCVSQIARSCSRSRNAARRLASKADSVSFHAAPNGGPCYRMESGSRRNEKSPLWRFALVSKGHDGEFGREGAVRHLSVIPPESEAQNGLNNAAPFHSPLRFRGRLRLRAGSYPEYAYSLIELPYTHYKNILVYIAYKIGIMRTVVSINAYFSQRRNKWHT